MQDKDNVGNGIFEYAAKGGHISFLNILLKKGAEIGDNSIIFASQGLRKRKNTLDTYKSLENLGVKLNIVDDKGRNPLHAIAYSQKENDI